MTSGTDGWKEQVLALTDGTVANVGVHGAPMTLHIEDLWIANIDITMGLVNTSSTPTLLKMVEQNKIGADKFVSHTFALSDIEEAYDVFARVGDQSAEGLADQLIDPMSAATTAVVAAGVCLASVADKTDSVAHTF